MATIPASAFVNVTPNVLTAGGSALDVIGLMLSSGTRVPIGSVAAYPSVAAVITAFGAGSAEAVAAAVYFAGFDNSSVKPASMLVAQYPISAVAAYLRGGNVSALTLTQLQAINGTLSVTIDAVLKTGTVNLAGATSFSNAAQIIADTLDIENGQAAAFTASITTTVMTVSAISSGTIAVGQLVDGAGTTPGTYIVSLGTGTGGIGTYNVNASQTVGSSALTTAFPGVTYDSISGGFVITSSTTGATSTITIGSGTAAAGLKLTTATGAVLSQGSAVGVPGTFMDAVAAITQNWATFFNLADPDNGSGNTLKLAFAAWTGGKNNRYAYIAWDNDPAPAASNAAPTSLGAKVAVAGYSGTHIIGQDANGIATASHAAFVSGAIASINFAELDGRADLAFRTQAGLLATCTDQTAMNNLIANGYNFYGASATANQGFVFLYPGSVSGAFLWLDSYINQIQLNAALQLALMVLLTQQKSVPYTPAGFGLIEAACADPINAALNFGTIRPGVVLSALQIAAVNAAAGVTIANTLQQRGWYLQVAAPGPAVRIARGSPIGKFWYTDGQSVQNINLTSTDVL